VVSTRDNDGSPVRRPLPRLAGTRRGNARRSGSLVHPSAAIAPPFDVGPSPIWAGPQCRHRSLRRLTVLEGRRAGSRESEYPLRTPYLLDAGMTGPWAIMRRVDGSGLTHVVCSDAGDMAGRFTPVTPWLRVEAAAGMSATTSFALLDISRA
jgi:hypothetical protein